VTAAEDELAGALRRAFEKSAEGSKPSSGRWWKIAAVTLAGGAALALTGGLAAPAIGGTIGTFFMELSGAAAVNAGLAWLGWGAVAAGGWGVAGGTSPSLHCSARQVPASAATRWVVGQERLRSSPSTTSPGRECTPTLPSRGWLSQKDDFTTTWKALPQIARHGEQLALRWESKHLLALGTAFAALSAKALAKKGLATWAKRASKVAARSLRWPATLLAAADVIDNPWHVAADRAEKAGAHLAPILAERIGAGGRSLSSDSLLVHA
jgi:hypothetical protein